MSDEMINIINQAKSQAKSDSLMKFILKNARILLYVAIILAIAAAGFVGFSYMQRSRQAKFSEILHKSLINQQIGNIEQAKENLEEIYNAKTAPGGVKSLASLRYAAFLLDEGKDLEAAKIYNEVHDCFSCDEYITDLAGLLAVKTWLSNNKEIAKDDLVERIKKIENSSSILRYYVTEQRALLESYKGNLKDSYEAFEIIAKNPEVSESLKNRANDGMKMIISKGYKPQEINKESEEAKS